MSTALVDAREKLAALRKSARDLYLKYDGDVGRMTTDELREFGRLNTEMDVEGKRFDQLRELDDAVKRNEEAYKASQQPAGQGHTFEVGDGRTEVVARQRDFGKVLKESVGLQQFKAQGGRGQVQIAELNAAEAKTLITLGTLAPVPVRQPGIREIAQEMRTVRDLMLQGQTNAPSFTYVVETTFTNAAVETAEGATKPESALAFTETTENVRKIPTWIPATDELLSDLDYMQSYIEGRLGLMVNRRLETQLLNGDGAGVNIRGILNRTGIQTQARGADNNMDAIFKAIVKVQNTGFAEPTAIVMNPTNFQTIRLAVNAQGTYIFGSPADPLPPRLWGYDIRLTTAMAAGTALVGAFRPDAQVFEREGLTISVSTEHSTYFIENKIAILAEMRVGLAVYRPASFCSVTGLT